MSKAHSQVLDSNHSMFHKNMLTNPKQMLEGFPGNSLFWNPSFIPKMNVCVLWLCKSRWIILATFRRMFLLQNLLQSPNSVKSGQLQNAHRNSLIMNCSQGRNPLLQSGTCRTNSMMFLEVSLYTPWVTLTAYQSISSRPMIVDLNSCIPHLLTVRPNINHFFATRTITTLSAQRS